MTTQRWIESFHVSFHSRCAVRWFIICDNITSRARPVVSRRAHTYIKLYVPTCVSCVCFRVKVCYICVLVWICVNGCCARYIAYINVIPKPQIYYSATLELQTAHSHSSLLAHSPHCVCRRCVCVCVDHRSSAARDYSVDDLCLFLVYFLHSTPRRMVYYARADYGSSHVLRAYTTDVRCGWDETHTTTRTKKNTFFFVNICVRLRVKTDGNEYYMACAGCRIYIMLLAVCYTSRAHRSNAALCTD